MSHSFTYSMCLFFPFFVSFFFFFFFFNDTATTEIYTLSLHDALPISRKPASQPTSACSTARPASRSRRPTRSEEHTSELQSRSDLVCRLLLEKKKNTSSHGLATFFVSSQPEHCRCA